MKANPLFKVYLGLMGLLVATFGFAQMPLGHFTLPLGLLIASLKLYLIAIFFMNLRRTEPVSRVFSAIGCFWLFILITLCLSDYLSRGWFELPSRWP